MLKIYFDSLLLYWNKINIIIKKKNLIFNKIMYTLKAYQAILRKYYFLLTTKNLIQNLNIS